MELPRYKRVRGLYFKRSDLNGWIEQGRRKTVEDIEKEADGYLKGK